MVNLSVVVPLFNEAPNIFILHEAITVAMTDITDDYEILFVDDGSEDETFEKCRLLVASDERLKVIRLRRNFGQTPAMAAGIDYASGRVIITMDGDLQNDPGDIHLLLDQLEQGFDMAVGWRYDRQDKLVTRRIPSRIANWLIGKVTGVPIKDNGCTLKAFSRATFQSVPFYADMHRFIPAMASLSGANIAEVKVSHHPRQYGVSKYGLSRVYKVLLDLLVLKMVVSFGSNPLRWFAYISVIPALVAGICLVDSGARYLHFGSYSVVIAGVGVLMLSASVILMMNGILCELIYGTGDLDLSKLAQGSTGVECRREFRGG